MIIHSGKSAGRTIFRGRRGSRASGWYLPTLQYGWMHGAGMPSVAA
jgi:hypothetical protein